jgi:hypothetical protein
LGLHDVTVDVPGATEVTEVRVASCAVVDPLGWPHEETAVTDDPGRVLDGRPDTAYMTAGTR